ncbi:MAG: cobyric acid synthase [Candidatus Tectimicrobiota bacterium]
MIMGCSSDAGKSFLVTALCRHLANRGVRVAPFKAQNMSNNAAVTPDGAEIGRAQYLQALAARATPQARMNPVLLKPSADTESQVVVMGRADPDLSALPWLERQPRLWPIVRAALASLQQDYEQVIIEGGGSPAEVNLRASDIVNMRVARECQAAVYITADIDRGGAFAHLLGTWQCLEADEQCLIQGFILNKFRGDPALLGDAMDWLRARTGIPTVALIPLVRHALPEEDALHHRATPTAGQINLALLIYPYASNLEEFDPLIHEPGVTVVPIRDFTRLDGYHAVLLPGSKNTVASLHYLRQSGLAAELSRVAQRGVPVHGICGGLQLLGQYIHDPHGLESGDCAGLGLLDVRTTLVPDKTTRQCEVLWNGLRLQGYEIHHGQTQAGPRVQAVLAQELGWSQDNVCGVYVHGLFENAAYRQQFLSRLGWEGQTTGAWSAVVEAHIEQVAQLIPAAGWSV